MEYLDTNVIIRFLTKDNPEQAARAGQVFREIDAGTRTVTTTEGVLVETVQVLSSKKLYALPREDIRRHLVNVLTLRGVKLPKRRIYLEALELYVRYPHLSFVDALAAIHTGYSHLEAVLSFDQGFDRVPGVTRHEP